MNLKLGLFPGPHRQGGVNNYGRRVGPQRQGNEHRARLYLLAPVLVRSIVRGRAPLGPFGLFEFNFPENQLHVIKTQGVALSVGNRALPCARLGRRRHGACRKRDRHGRGPVLGRGARDRGIAVAPHQAQRQAQCCTQHAQRGEKRRAGRRKKLHDRPRWTVLRVRTQTRHEEWHRESPSVRYQVRAAQTHRPYSSYFVHKGGP